MADCKQKITSERLSLLLEDFWNSNAHKPSVPRVTFVPEVKKALVEHNLFVTSSITENLASILVKHLHLSVEAVTSCLDHSRHLPEWCADRPVDSRFGSLGNFLDVPLAGKNILFVSLQAPSKTSFDKKMEKVKRLVLSNFQRESYSLRAQSPLLFGRSRVPGNCSRHTELSVYDLRTKGSDLSLSFAHACYQQGIYVDRQH